MIRSVLFSLSEDYTVFRDSGESSELDSHVQLRYATYKYQELLPATFSLSIALPSAHRLPTISMPDTISLGRSSQQHQLNPYSNNGGTILAIAGANFSVIAGDTSKTDSYDTQARYAPRVFRL